MKDDKSPEILVAEGRIVHVNFTASTVHPPSPTGSLDAEPIGALTDRGAAIIDGRLFRFVDINGRRPAQELRNGTRIALLAAEPVANGVQEHLINTTLGSDGG